jgi:hypothetical protein
MRSSFPMHLIAVLAIAFAGPTLAQTDPSLSQVYAAVRMGHLEQAQKMMKEVLHDHPASAKAHYVAAQVNADSGDFVQGRQELRLAQELAPGLPFAAPESVRELQDKLVAGEEIARHLLDSGVHEVNSPPANEIAPDQRDDEHLGGANFGVSGASSWNDDDRASGGDDWT